MKKIHLLLSIAVMSLLTSCLKDQEDIFDKTAVVRAEEAIAADYKILAGAENGWLMSYYPSPYLTYGGYNVIMKFTEDGHVTVASDIADPGDTAESLYKLTQSAGVVLSFDTYNDILHKFSDPSAPLGGSTGKGWEGDYDFEVLSATATEVKLKGKKTGNYATLVPMEGSWKDYIEEVQAVEEEMFFTEYSMKVDTVDVEIVPSYRTLEMTYSTGEADTIINVPFVVKPDGLEFQDTLTIGSTKISGFKYAKGTVNYASTDGAVTLTGIVPPVNEVFVKGMWSTSMSNIGTFGKPYWEAFRDSALPWFNQYYPGTLSYFYFGSYNGSFGAIYVLCGYVGINGFSYELSGEDEVTLAYNAQGDNGNGGAFFSYGIMQYLLAPFGCDARGNSVARTFKVTSDSPKSPSEIILTDKDNPNNVIRLVNDDIENALVN